MHKKVRSCGFYFYRREKMIVFNFGFYFKNYLEHVGRRDHTAVIIGRTFIYPPIYR